jgi:tetratricopeptide (TPR) repeat protein
MRTVPVEYRAPYLLQLGKIYYDLRQYNDAKGVFNRILILEPNNEVARKYINSMVSR